MNWKKLLCEKRQCNQNNKNNKKNNNDMRNEFQKDYHRIIGSASFRRLQDKTQVFPLDKSDFVRTRLTHSLEVASFAKSLGQSSFLYIIDHIDSFKNKSGFRSEFEPSNEDINKICSILECAGLIHDIGNPPFGHFGEYSIRIWFKNNLENLKIGKNYVKDLLNEQMCNDFYNFEGNAQALRLLTKLHYLVDENGMHLTYALLNTIVKYPVSSCDFNTKSGDIKNKKMGYYYAEKDLYDDISESTGAVGCRYPLTFLLEAADDIAYRTADIEDAVKKNYLTYDMILEELKKDAYLNMCKGEEKGHYLDAVKTLENKYEIAKSKKIANPDLYAVQNWIVSIQGFLISCAIYGFTSNYIDIMNGTFKSEILKVSHGNVLMKALGNITAEKVFESQHIQKLEISAGTIIDFLLDKFVNAAISYDTEIEQNALDRRLMNIISQNYMSAYRHHSREKTKEEKLYLRLLLVTDYICGMTDTYAKTLYQELHGIS